MFTRGLHVVRNGSRLLSRSAVMSCALVVAAAVAFLPSVSRADQPPPPRSLTDRKNAQIDKMIEQFCIRHRLAVTVEYRATQRVQLLIPRQIAEHPENVSMIEWIEAPPATFGNAAAGVALAGCIVVGGIWLVRRRSMHILIRATLLILGGSAIACLIVLLCQQQTPVRVAKAKVDADTIIVDNDQRVRFIVPKAYKPAGRADVIEDWWPPPEPPPRDPRYRPDLDKKK